MGLFREKREALAPLLRSVKSMSFSQYGEDLLLAVTLLPTRQGRYVDVGAYHPWRASNTYKLYLRGWSGLTIEPNPHVAPLFRKMRPRDTHVVSGVAARPAQLRYYLFDDSKLNTFSEAQANVYINSGFKIIGELQLPCRPLQDILDEHGVDRLDLLSIDCEGHDRDALESLDFSRCRPTAILVEDYDAFEKLKKGEGRSSIEEMLRGRGYVATGQAMYSTLYVDTEALRLRKNGAFRLADVQFS
jgi:FkbM family methyltransferase